MLPLSSDGTFDLEPWRWADVILNTARADIAASFCAAAPTFVHRRAPDWLHGLTLLHLAALFGKLELAKVLLARGANKNARGAHGETALGFVVERGVEAEIREWIELLGEGAAIPTDVLIETIVEKITSETVVVEMLLDAGLVEHTEIERLSSKNENRTLAFLPLRAQRVVLSGTHPHGLYGAGHQGHDCSLHLQTAELDKLVPDKRTIKDKLLLLEAVKTRVIVRGCVHKGIVCEKVIKALANTDASAVLMHDLSGAIVQFVWNRCRPLYLFQLLLDLLYIVLLVVVSGLKTYDHSHGPDTVADGHTNASSFASGSRDGSTTEASPNSAGEDVLVICLALLTAHRAVGEACELLRVMDDELTAETEAHGPAPPPLARSGSFTSVSSRVSDGMTHLRDNSHRRSSLDISHGRTQLMLQNRSSSQVVPGSAYGLVRARKRRSKLRLGAAAFFSYMFHDGKVDWARISLAIFCLDTLRQWRNTPLQRGLMAIWVAWNWLRIVNSISALTVFGPRVLPILSSVQDTGSFFVVMFLVIAALMHGYFVLNTAGTEPNLLYANLEKVYPLPM